MTRAERIEHVVMGVIAQAMRDAHAETCTVAGSGEDARLLRDWCTRAFGLAALSENGLRLHAINKTALLLGFVPPADVLPFGDLYYSQVVELAGGAELPPSSAEIATVCGGPAELDTVLERFFEQRTSFETAADALSTSARDRLREALEAARFRRTRVPVVPKIGGRTLGIDLFA